MAKFADIPQFPRANYTVSQSWDYLEEWIKKEETELKLNLNPKFQRAHVWTREQQIAYVEYQLRGGESGRTLYFNHPGWMIDWKGDYVIVDGKQRLEAARAFMRNEIPAFEYKREEYKDKFPWFKFAFRVQICNLNNEADILRWYLAINSGGTPHSPDEINRVRKMLKELEK